MGGSRNRRRAPMRPTPDMPETTLFRIAAEAQQRRGPVASGASQHRQQTCRSTDSARATPRRRSCRRARSPSRRRVLMAAERSSRNIFVRAARVAPSCTEVYRPPTGRSDPGRERVWGRRGKAICPSNRMRNVVSAPHTCCPTSPASSPGLDPRSRLYE